MTIEDIYDEIGGFGNFQCLMIACVYSMKMAAGWSMLQMSYGALTPPYRCQTPDQSAFSNKSSDHSHNSTGDLNVCSVNSTQCAAFSFLGSPRTVVSEWDLVCSTAWIKYFITSIQMSGVLVGASISGYAGDYFGRKKTIYVCYFLHAVLNVIAAFSVSWQMFVVLRFCLGIGIGTILVVTVPFMVEFYPVRWRAFISGIPCWQMGVAMFAGTAKLLEDWSYLHIACAIIAIPNLLSAFYIPESPRWLAVKDRTEEAFAVLQKVSRANRKKLPSNTLAILQTIARREKELQTSRRYSYIDVLRGRHMVRCTLAFCFTWVTLSLVTYGLQFAVSSLSGDIYLNIFIMGIVDIPSCFATFPLTNRLGRQMTSQIFLGIGSVSSFCCLLAYLLADEATAGAVINVFSMITKLAIGASCSAIQSWVIEVYPTVTRNMAYGVVNTAARIGGIISPFAVNLDDLPVFSFVLMGSTQLASLLLLLLVPETRGRQLQESIVAAHKNGHDPSTWTKPQGHQLDDVTSGLVTERPEESH